MDRHGDHLDRIAVVFPNKRASLFLNQELTQIAGHAIWSPAYITISDLFRKQSRLNEADPLLLVTILHKVFTQVTGSSESLDDFWGWGETMLSDFDDIDKHMANADKVLRNISDLRELDSLDYLTTEQRELLNRFFSTFVERESSLQRSFSMLWSKLGEIYTKFKSELLQRRLAYEGMLYRDVVETESYSFPYDNYIFVGFNLLQEVEQRLFQAAKQEGKAEFFWDYDGSYLADDSPFFEAGQFIKRYLSAERFPSIIPQDDPIYHCADAEKHIEYVASPSDTLQASYVANWLSQEVETTDAEGNIVKLHRYELGSRCAVVLCNEAMLPSVLGSLDEQIGKVNVTIGFPLQHSPAASLVANLLSLRLEGSRRDDQEFRLKHASRLLRHPYVRLLSPAIEQQLALMMRERRFWWRRERLTESGDEALQLLFGPIQRDGDGEMSPLSQLLRWCMEVVHAVGLAAGDGDQLMLESLYRMHALLSRLQMLMADGTLAVDSSTMRRLIDRLVNSTSVPFHGEPAEGVQIMGVLETRNLDFEQMLLLSASDEFMPKTSAMASFVPYNVRKAYGLTVADDQVAIYAYYFYRMLQRAQSATLCYNSNSDERGQSEMSRFMMQLLLSRQGAIEMKELSLNAVAQGGQIEQVAKTADVMQILLGRTTFSATELGQYMRCPMKYYFINVLGLREPESDEDEIENTDFGTIFHYSMELIYRQLTDNLSHPDVAKSQISNFLKRHGAVEEIVDRAFADKFFFRGESAADGAKAVRQRLPELNGVQVINHSAVCAYVRRTLQSDMATAPFAIRGLEERNLNFSVTLPDGTTMQLKGSIDRLDEMTDASGQRYLRVIDYKTGRPNDKEPKDLGDIFRLDEDKNWHPDYYLQALLYCIAVADDPKLNPHHLPVRPALLFVSANVARRIDPILRVDGQPILAANDYRPLISDGVTQMISEIRLPELPFQPTQFDVRCNSCAFIEFCKA